MAGAVDPRAGKPVDPSTLVDLAKLEQAYFDGRPDPADPAQRVAFGTSGHRGSAFHNAFNEGHIVAIAQAICLYRTEKGIDGPLYVGKDTHALSAPAFASALEVFAANRVTTMVDAVDGYTPTPAVSHAILTHNRGRDRGLADGVVITPSHNPPEDGGFKYNPPHGGPAGSDITDWIERKANEILAGGLKDVRRMPYEQARRTAGVHRHDYVAAYVGDLDQVIDMQAIASAGINIGIDPLGGAAAGYWHPLIERYGLKATVVNDGIDPTFRFMTADWDGRIRMDCSSPYAMAGLIAQRDRFDVAFANDTDADRHGIVTRSSGLMNPNHYLTAAIAYLFTNRPGWPTGCAIGKTAVSSSAIDRVAAKLGRRLVEVPVGFKWFVDGLLDGSFGFGCEESAGASFLRRDGSVWTTDKDGIILGLLAAEITARSGRDPGELYAGLTAELGTPVYERIDAPASRAQKAVLKGLSPAQIESESLAGEPILERLTAAPGNGASLGGIKVTTRNGWFAARPSGTEEVYKIYAESFLGADHLARIQDEARSLIGKAFAAAGAA